MNTDITILIQAAVALIAALVSVFRDPLTSRRWARRTWPISALGGDRRRGGGQLYDSADGEAKKAVCAGLSGVRG